MSWKTNVRKLTGDARGGCRKEPSSTRYLSIKNLAPQKDAGTDNKVTTGFLVLLSRVTFVAMYAITAMCRRLTCSVSCRLETPEGALALIYRDIFRT